MLLYLSLLLSMYHRKLLGLILSDVWFEFHLRMTYCKQTMSSMVPIYSQLDNYVENELNIFVNNRCHESESIVYVCNKNLNLNCYMNAC